MVKRCQSQSRGNTVEMTKKTAERRRSFSGAAVYLERKSPGGQAGQHCYLRRFEPKPIFLASSARRAE